MIFSAHKKLSFPILLMCIYYIVKTFLILNGRLSLRIPANKKPARKYDLRKLLQINEKIEIILNRLKIKTGHLCFYRSYVVVSIFRRLGVPVQINIGLWGLEGKQNCAGGHAWVTLDQQFLRDEKDARHLYPFKLGMDNQGINYWVGPRARNHILRIKQ